MHKLFVYGTLMKGQWNEIVMDILGGRLVAAGDVHIHGYMLHIVQLPGNLRLPFILANEKGTVYGELYNVPSLEEMDQFEAGYDRAEVDVQLGTGGTVRAWAYVFKSVPANSYPVPEGRYTRWR